MDINIKPIDPDPKVPDEPIDIYTMHPWHHPGRAPVWSPCGIGGGNPRGCFKPGTNIPTPCPEGAAQNGPDARYFPFPDVKTTVWKKGGVAETAWNVVANVSPAVCLLPHPPCSDPLRHRCIRHLLVVDYTGFAETAARRFVLSTVCVLQC